MSYCIISGAGEIPFEIGNSIINELQERVFFIIIEGVNYDKKLEKFDHIILPIGKISKAMQEMRKRNVKKIIFVGGIKMPNLSNVKPDLQGSILLTKILLKKQKGDNAILSEVGNFFESNGFEIIGADEILKQKNQNEDILYTQNLDQSIFEDIKLGINILNIISEFDIGQAIVVANSRIIGIEGIEGTDELIKRCGKYYKTGDAKMILIKMPKILQNLKFDMPTIGANTISLMHEKNFQCLAISNEKTLFTNKNSINNAIKKTKLSVFNID